MQIWSYNRAVELTSQEVVITSFKDYLINAAKYNAAAAINKRNMGNSQLCYILTEQAITRITLLVGHSRKLYFS